ncbi:maleylpyruvate isomerase family mycothiol-dependent enzyme [Mumia zhuanghuii]|uniref:Maleylpyruvate isomerase family mycothiol-dependent enzyme n=2 Tax=Mumia TaxID=1546255 RepID=A0ABW1QFK5_9ACTN|nr:MULTISPECIES: maleylpyruvate isomerase family mycothiol-dependent enzyme [Mumia]KAA1424572.1 maleylpyruvate isomerase family mycothiol-dependent enzyme [Mumia zhuanghuii]
MDLSLYVAGWAESAERTLSLLDGLPTDAWTAPTGCPGWTVRDVVAHLAALESELAGTGRGGPSGAASNGGEVSAAYTEAGVDQRADMSPTELVEEFRTAYTARRAALETLPDDPKAMAEGTPGGIAWSNEVLLRNRLIDMFVHEQDIRSAVGQPGGYDGRAAVIVVSGFLLALPYVLAKKLKAETGTALVLEISGPVNRTVTVEVGEDGRGRLHDGASDDPAAHLSMTTETFVDLVAGREILRPVSITWTGDSSLVGDVLAEIAITP